jgi:rhamnosyltransferase
MGHVESRSGVVAVITAFRPEGESLAALVRSLLPQTDAVVVVDDGSHTPLDFEEAVAAGATLVTQQANLGIASALNAGVRAARDLADPEFVVTFDQDSSVASDYVDDLVATARAAESAGIRVGLVAPRRVEGLPPLERGERAGFTLGSEPIQSGLLIPVGVIDAVGPFTERLFIDCVDTDYYIRVRDAGFEVVLAASSSLGHALGRLHVVRLGGRELHLTHAATFRYYYIARNRILMNRLHGSRHRGWTVQQTVRDARHLGVSLALVPGRRRRLQAIVAGIRDGWAGRGGRIPAEDERRVTGG